MNEISEEERKRIMAMSTHELLESGEWVKLYDIINPSLKLYESDSHSPDQKLRSTDV